MTDRPHTHTHPMPKSVRPFFDGWVCECGICKGIFLSNTTAVKVRIWFWPFEHMLSHNGQGLFLVAILYYWVGTPVPLFPRWLIHPWEVIISGGRWRKLTRPLGITSVPLCWRMFGYYVRNYIWMRDNLFRPCSWCNWPRKQLHQYTTLLTLSPQTDK